MGEHFLDDVAAVAEPAHSASRKWHSHVLAPSCCFDPSKDRCGLVVEIPIEGIIVVAFVSERPIDQGKKLVALPYGSELPHGRNERVQIDSPQWSSPLGEDVWVLS